MKKILLATIAIFSLLAGVSAALGGQSAPAQAAVTTTSYGAGAYTGTNPIGGGAGYTDIKTSGTYHITKSTSVTSFISTLANAKSGETVYLDGDVELNLSDHYGTVVPGGVTLASNRGYSGSAGALLYSSTPHNYIGMLLPGNNSRITGLRIRGPNGTTSGSGTDYGIFSQNHYGLEVDNCEVSCFGFAAIAYFYDGRQSFSTTDGGYIHNNYIHHNQLDGYGYGVSVAQAWCIIEANIFDYGRHFVMGARSKNTAATPCNYDVRYNIFGSHCTNMLVDCHGGDDAYSETSTGYYGPDPDWNAGGTLLVHYNTFQHPIASTTTARGSFVIRGIPKVKAEAYGNWTYWTYSALASGAFQQRVGNLGYSSYQKMTVHDNWYGTTPPPSTTSTNHAPVLSAIGAKSTVAGTTLSFTISATDPDGDSLTYSAANLPSGATFTPSTRTFSWTPQSGQSGAHSSIHFQVSDGSLTDSEDITITITVSNTLQGDVNTDGDVNSLDMIRVGQHWGETGAKAWIPEDINQDGSVSVLDATLVGQHWTG